MFQCPLHLWQTQQHSKMSSLRCFLPSRCRHQHLQASIPSPQNSPPCHWKKDSQNGPLHLPVGANKQTRNTLSLAYCTRTVKRMKGSHETEVRYSICVSIITNEYYMAKHCFNSNQHPSFPRIQNVSGWDIKIVVLEQAQVDRVSTLDVVTQTRFPPKIYSFR